MGNSISPLLLGCMALNNGMFPVIVGVDVDFWCLVLSLSVEWLSLLLNFLLASSNLLKFLLVGGFGQGVGVSVFIFDCIFFWGLWGVLVVLGVPILVDFLRPRCFRSSTFPSTLVNICWPASG